MKTAAIIQARMNSTRLPGKVLLPLNNKPVLHHIIETCEKTQLIDEIIIATTSNTPNLDILNNIAIYNLDNNKNTKVYVYQGKEDNVLDRVIKAAEHYNVDTIVDITADCPLVDYTIINDLLGLYYYSFKIEEKGYDYVSNVVERTFPDGLDVQVYSLNALKKVQKKYNPPHHVGWNIAQHPNDFYIYNVSAHGFMCWPELGLTLDTKEDYEFLKMIFEKFKDKDIYTIVAYLKKHPELILNKNVRRKTPEEG